MALKRAILEAVLQLGAIPTLSEIDWRARTAVQVVLNGAGPGETSILERPVLCNGGGPLPVATRRAWVYLR